MSEPPRLSAAQERLRAVRHDLRNKLTTINNAAAYLRLRLRESPEWDDDGKCQPMFALIDEAIDQAEDILANRLTTDLLSESVGSENGSSDG